MTKKSLVLLFLLTGLGTLWAQSNEFEDHYLAAPQAEFSGSVYLVLAAAGLVPADATPQVALNKLKELGWNVTPSAKGITYGEFALLVMKAFNIPGGIMYHFFPTPRYAAHELTYRGDGDSRWDPDHLLSPDEALRILNAVMGSKEGRS